MKQRLTAKEEEVMNIIWAKGEVFIRDIVAALPDPKPNYNTVATQVKFLEEKGFVKRKPMANSFQYSPALTERDYHGTTVGDVVSRYYNNSYISLVSQFVEEDKMDVEDLKNSFRKSKAKGNDRLHRNERVAAFRVLRILYAADAEDNLLHFQPILLDGWQPALLGAAARPLGFQRNRGLERHPDPDAAASGGQRGRRNPERGRQRNILARSRFRNILSRGLRCLGYEYLVRNPDIPYDSLWRAYSERGVQGYYRGRSGGIIQLLGSHCDQP